MASKITFECESCDFTFTDSSLIFYFNEMGKLVEETLKMDSSNKMCKSPLSGFIYESYCPHCQEIIKTYVPETHLTMLSIVEINEILSDYIGKSAQILFLDFENSTGIERRNILKNGKCPICTGEVSLIFDSNNTCPKCDSKMIESLFK